MPVEHALLGHITQIFKKWCEKLSNVPISSYCFRKEDCPDYSSCTDSTPRSISVSYNGTSCVTVGLHAKISYHNMHFRKIL